MENLFGSVGQDLQSWLLFSASTAFYAGRENLSGFGATGPTWWQGGLIFLGTTLVLLILALASAKRRDA